MTLQGSVHDGLVQMSGDAQAGAVAAASAGS